MDQAASPFNVYDLMFGKLNALTIGEIDVRVRSVSTRTLIDALGLGIVLGSVFDFAFQSDDLRNQIIPATIFGPIATELESRGIRIPKERDEILEAFAHWTRNMSTQRLKTEYMSSRAAQTLYGWARDAERRIGPSVDP